MGGAWARYLVPTTPAVWRGSIAAHFRHCPRPALAAALWDCQGHRLRGWAGETGLGPPRRAPSAEAQLAVVAVARASAAAGFARTARGRYPDVHVSQSPGSRR